MVPVPLGPLAQFAASDARPRTSCRSQVRGRLRLDGCHSPGAAREALPFPELWDPEGGSWAGAAETRLTVGTGPPEALAFLRSRRQRPGMAAVEVFGEPAVWGGDEVEQFRQVLVSQCWDSRPRPQVSLGSGRSPSLPLWLP